MNKQFECNLIETLCSLRSIGDLLAYAGLRPYSPPSHPMILLHREVARWSSESPGVHQKMSNNLRHMFARVAYKLSLTTLWETLNQSNRVSWGMFNSLLDYLIYESIKSVELCLGDEVKQLDNFQAEFHRLYELAHRHIDDYEESMGWNGDLSIYDVPINLDLITEIKPLVVSLLLRPEMQFSLQREVEQLIELLRQMLLELRQGK